jgi:hypothetical protein
MSDMEYARLVEQHFAALNRALEGIPADRVRLACPGIARWCDLFVPRGYALVAVDVRGTGASFGTRDSFRSHCRPTGPTAGSAQPLAGAGSSLHNAQRRGPGVTLRQPKKVGSQPWRSGTTVRR